MLIFSSISSLTNLNNSKKYNCTVRSKFCVDNIIDPVCAWYDSSVECKNKPCAKNESNDCFACYDHLVIFYTKGKCPSKIK